MNEIWKPIPGFDGYEASNTVRADIIGDGAVRVIVSKENKNVC